MALNRTSRRRTQKALRSTRSQHTEPEEDDSIMADEVETVAEAEDEEVFPEGEIKDEEEEDDDYEEEKDTSITNQNDDEDDEEENKDADDSKAGADEEADAEEEEEEQANDVQSRASRSRGSGNKKRKTEEEPYVEKSSKKAKPLPLDENGKPIVIEEDQVVTEDDPAGETKIDKNGVLQGGRQFKCKTFTIAGRGDKLYMIATEAARFVGYRDSYFLFQKHKKLYKVIINDEEKVDLISRGLLSSSYKTRTIYLVAARSIYKEFGAKIIIKGKQITDDYQEAKAREEGGSVGAPAVVPVEYHLTQSASSELGKKFGNGSGPYNSQTLDSSLISGNPEDTWIYDQAVKVRQFDSMLLYDRLDVLNSKLVRDPYTGVHFVPDITQPTKFAVAKIDRVVDPDVKKKLIFDTTLKDNLVIKTGLIDVPLEFFDGIVDEETKAAILEQQKLESEW